MIRSILEMEILRLLDDIYSFKAKELSAETCCSSASTDGIQGIQICYKQVFEFVLLFGARLWQEIFHVVK
jgi:hypothetical protein